MMQILVIWATNIRECFTFISREPYCAPFMQNNAVQDHILYQICKTSKFQGNILCIQGTKYEHAPRLSKLYREHIETQLKQTALCCSCLPVVHYDNMSMKYKDLKNQFKNFDIFIIFGKSIDCGYTLVSLRLCFKQK